MEPQTVNLDNNISREVGYYGEYYILEYCNTDPDTVVGNLYTSVTTKNGGDGEPVGYGKACPDETCPQYSIFLGYVDEVTDKHAWAVLYDRRKTTLIIQSSPPGIISGSVTLYRGAIVGDDIECWTSDSVSMDYDGTLWNACSIQIDDERPGVNIGYRGAGNVDISFDGMLIDDNKTYTVEFTKTYEKIDVESGIGGTATTSSQPSDFCDGGNGYERGTTVTLTATPDECHEFVRWEAETTKRGELYEDIHGINGSTSSQITITASGFYSYLSNPGYHHPYEYGYYNTTIKAIFRKKTFRVALSCSPLSGGDITDPHQDGEVRYYECGKGIYCIAVAAQCYWLDYWSINGSILRVLSPHIVVDRDYDIVAHFVEKEYKTQGTKLVHDDNGRLIYKCGGKLIYGSCTEDESKKPILQQTGS